MTLEELRDKKIAILGLGLNNRKLAAYLKARGVAFQVIENWQTPMELISKIDNFHIVFRTPGLPFNSPAIQQAKAKGVIIYSQTKLFFDLCPCPIIGVTGTKGKGTTATLLSKILEAAGKKVWLSGNIGQDPFEFIEKINSADIAVLELSSFQLQDLHKSPHIAVVLRIFPEHLDHHQSREEYITAKKPIVAYQGNEDFAIINYDYETTREFATFTLGQVIWNSTVQDVKSGCFVKDEKVVLSWRDETQEILPVSAVKLLGRFNLENVTAAIAAAAAGGVNHPETISKAVSGFTGLQHRLEFVAEIRGVKFYNDSFSTTPETTVAALSAFSSPIILVVGGSEKNSDYSSLAQAIANRQIKALIPIGITGPRIAEMASQAGFQGRIPDRKFKDMRDIVESAKEVAANGDTVLLSPASASFDMFKNYQHRGELFKKFVRRL